MNMKTMMLLFLTTLPLLLLVAISPLIVVTAAAQTTTTTTEEEATTTTTPPEGIIELSPEPVYQERQIVVSETAINQTHVELAVSGEGTLTLPNTTETISTTSTGSLIVSLDGTAAGKEVITTEDGSESVTATFYAIARFGMEGGRGIVIALLDTNSTGGRLAPLDGMILAGQTEIPLAPEEPALLTLSEWQSGIPLPPSPSPPTPLTEEEPSPPTEEEPSPPTEEEPSPPTEEEPSPLTDTTTANATTTAPEADGATLTAPAPEQGEGEGEGEEQTTPTLPAPNPLFE
jgi:hypothetical protein